MTDETLSVASIGDGRRRSPANRRRIDERGRGFTVDQKAVEQVAEVIDRAQMDLQVEAVLTCDAMALANFGNRPGKFLDPAQVAADRLDADDGRQLVAEGPRIDLRPVTGDDSRLLKPPYALGHSRRGEVHAPAQLRERQAAVVGELANDPTVDLV